MEAPSNFEQKKTAEDAFSQEELKGIILEWRKKAHWRSKQYNRFAHVAFFGGPLRGKSSTLTSIFRSLYPALADKPVAGKIPRHEPVCYRLMDNLFLWKLPSVTDSLENTKRYFSLENDELPKFDVVCLFLTCPDAKDEKYMNLMKEMIEFLKTKNIPFYIYVVKVDEVSPRELGENFDRLSAALSTENIPIPKELLLPVKNHTPGRMALLLDYFILRVLDRTMSVIEDGPVAVPPVKYEVKLVGATCEKSTQTCDIEMGEEKSS